MNAQTAPFTIRTVHAPREYLLSVHAQWPERYPALLESAAPCASLGRFDLLFAFPQQTLTKLSAARDRFLPTLTDHFLAERRAHIDCHLPFTGGWLVFLGYELAAEIEPTLTLPPAPTTVDAIAMRIPAALIYDHEAAQLHLVAESQRVDLLGAMHADLRAAIPLAHSPPLRVRVREDDPAEFLRDVRKAKEHIAAGHVYQVNLSRAWSIELDQPTVAPAELYRSLRSSNPAPFAASLVTSDCSILSSSPERLFSIRAGVIATRPIAGTRPRMRRHSARTSMNADAAERALLAAHPKERAEHVMLVDLERNDLGRVCQPGTVHVDELMTLESYEHVHHIVSNVSGRLREDTTPADVLRAIFPGGTITGCPKIRAMQIIADLERIGRGAYTGSLGYLNHDGSGDFNILIRTMTYRPSSGEVRFRAGAGIVADSDPWRELAETRAKAEGLLRAFRANATARRTQ